MDRKISFNRYPNLRFGLYLPRKRCGWAGLVIFAFVFCSIFIGHSMALAQPPLGLMPNQDLNASGIPPGLRPDAVYMKNEAGDTVLVPRLRYEEFERYLQSSTEGPLEGNVVGIDSMSLEVRVDQLLARIRGNLGTLLREPNKKWLSIPIALGNLQMVPKALDQQSSDSRIGIGASSSGYVWRLPPGQAGNRVCSFESVANIASSPQGNSLRLDLPNAPCVIRFYVPVSDWELSINGMGSEVIEPISGPTETSHYLVRASGGTLSATWTRRASSDSIQATEAVSNNKLTATSNPDLFSVSTSIVLRGPKRLGGRRFLLTLPPGSEWRESSVTPPLFSGFKITRRDAPVTSPVRLPIDENKNQEGSTPSEVPTAIVSEKPESQQGTVLSIDVDESMSSSELEVGIQWQTTAVPIEDNVEFPLPVMDGVQRHSGTLELAIPRNRILLWNPQPGIALQKQATSVIESADVATYSFRFASQPAAVRCKLITPSSTPQIRAEHRLVHQQDRLQLISTIEFLEDPRNFAFLQLESQGWMVERATVLSTGRELNTASSGDPNGKMVIPLSVNDLLEIGDPVSTPAPSTTATSATPESVRNRKVSLQLARRFPIADSGNKEEGEETIEFLLPTISWLDEASSQRRSWCPQGKLTAQSTVSILDFARESTAFQASGSDMEVARFDSTAKEAASQRTYPIPNIRSTADTWLRGEPDAIRCFLRARALGTEIESNATVRIVATPDESRWEQDWLLQIRGVAPKVFHVAIPKAWITIPQDANSSASESAESLQRVELDVNGVALTEWLKCSKEEIDRLSERYSAEWRMQMEWYTVSVPATIATNTPADSPWLVTLHTHDIPFPTVGRTSYHLQMPFACLDSADAKVSMRTTSWACLIQSSQYSKLLLNETNLERSTSEIQIGSERRLQSRLSIPIDDPRIDAILVPTQLDQENKVYVERVWVQSVVKTTELRHRYVIRFRTDRPSIVIHPPNELLSEPEILLNGQSVSLEVEPLPSSGYRLDLTSVPDLRVSDAPSASPSDLSTGGRVYVLEFFSWPSQPSSWMRKLNLPVAKIQGSNVSRASTVWQIISSKSDHLFSTSETLDPNYRWKWSDVWFAREDLWDQEGLERSLGATAQAPLGPQTNRYTLISLSSTKEQYVQLVPKFLLWIPAALLSLFACYVALEFKWLRHPLAWTAAVALILALSQLSFDATVVFSQAFVVATLVSVLFVVIRWAVDHRARRRSVFAGRSTYGSTMFPSRSDSKAEPLSGSGVMLSQATTISPSQEAAKNILPDPAGSVGR